MDFKWIVYEKKEGLPENTGLKIKGGFPERIDALNYASMMRDINRMAGYRDDYVVEENINLTITKKSSRSRSR
ncbi:MAG: hypothetical protein J5981_05510 [Lachnospira sp.]|nr:hypothetical protein [Lachnospira sp.]